MKSAAVIVGIALGAIGAVWASRLPSVPRAVPRDAGPVVTQAAGYQSFAPPDLTKHVDRGNALPVPTGYSDINGRPLHYGGVSGNPAEQYHQPNAR